ncbi:MAG: transcription elongation factor Spt5 [Desulfurococcales archaeon]|nr:transcription elongation factor Spt5 [Desulfurococcales archaeon]MCE4605328.1 transcription elongation factor Spt5 [Desulfurococcales archaeon]
MTDEGESLHPSTFYALAVTGGTEERVALLLAERARRMGLDLRSVLVSPKIKRYIIVEVGDPNDFYILIRGVKNLKRRRPIKMKVDEVVGLAKPEREVPKLERGQVVEVTGGPFKGMRGRIVEVYEGRGEVDLTLLESDFRMVVTIPIDQVKPVEE